MHYINATTEDVDAHLDATMHHPEADFENEADFLFIGNPDINIPPT